MKKNIQSALISVYNKEGLEPLVKKMDALGIRLFSTGGTYDFIQSLNIPVTAVEDITSFPEVFGGRVKTLHPAIFGGILFRRSNESDRSQAAEFNIPAIDLVIVDLYPFEQTLATTDDEQSIIEKIDIGGISLIRAAAKNFEDVVIIPSINQYSELSRILNEQHGFTELAERQKLAAEAFNTSSHYDSVIFSWFNQQTNIPVFKQSIQRSTSLRYGENPHQNAAFYGNLDDIFEHLHGKEISYNNLLDLDAGLHLIDELGDHSVAILKHNNACGVAVRDNLLQAWQDALAGDPVSAFGGVIVCNQKLDEATAKEINTIFFEIIVAPDYEKSAFEILSTKKNRIILQRKDGKLPDFQYRTILNGVAFQQKDLKKEQPSDLSCVSNTQPDATLTDDLLFANTIVKHTKSNAIVVARNLQLLGSGTGQTSRVDAVKQALAKASAFGFNLTGAVLASDAFFPFADSVEIAHNAGITAFIQPGGSIRDKDSIEYCNEHGLGMLFTGIRHFKH
ncbi:MAG: bifunctional phosphoribosylaminoimidazolecarboxamide formyltransferase/IMP cyclohydrolase [Bacteroidales bacterium]|nr:bifunctional phosphoribosylaminoimidazolecarboxamide formyltransferase/IMP cyclohydrolase [Bacteroidales bacterium]